MRVWLAAEARRARAADVRRRFEAKIIELSQPILGEARAWAIWETGLNLSDPGTRFADFAALLDAAPEHL